ncbi:tripartite tricarboxylate transporter TctB family protein [Oceanobacillus jeddahense]|uniref:Tripartite tricarboxylate transporter TctB family protein n=1 Tax=Oceanobacillus jeddahense TaxID=1462527 RepID=A0ABY5JW23_9BACI|nr:tripartite tricarboxylate transporter TctB family protein [Oceanobacillus jeddahense]UUI03052.1 tripartite tricarboxylate transporter TctB family protein [Oceanobacillus jeddahense]
MKKMVIFIVATYVISLLFLILSFDLPRTDEVSAFTGPAQWPVALIIFILVLNTLLLFNTIKSGKKKEEILLDNEEESLPDHVEEILPDDVKELTDTEMETNTEQEDTSWVSKNKHYILIGLLILYTALLQYTGFIVATIIFFPLCSILMGARNKILLAVSSVLATFLVYGMFELLLNVPLP